MKVRCIKDVLVNAPTKYRAFTSGDVYQTHTLASSKTNRLLADDNRGVRCAIDDADMGTWFSEHFELADA